MVEILGINHLTCWPKTQGFAILKKTIQPKKAVQQLPIHDYSPKKISFTFQTFISILMQKKQQASIDNNYMKELIAEKKQCKKCNQIIDPNKKNSWGHNLLLSIDQFGNAVANGNPDSTISARVGYYANYGLSESKYPWYWKFMEKMIDFAWWPIERKNHCKEAYDADPEIPYPGNGLAKTILFILALVFSLFVSTLSYISWLIFPTVRKRFKCESCHQIVIPGTSNQSLKLEINEKIIEEIEGAFQYLKNQIGRKIEITDRISTIEDNYDRHFATTSIVKLELMSFSVRTSGGIGMIEGKDGQTVEFSGDYVSEISRTEEEIIINLAIKDVIFRRIEIRIK